MAQPLDRRTAGFTIVELLLVVTIIGVLAGLLLPAIEQARSSARRTACQSNLRQWALAVQCYADIYKGRLPFRGQGAQPIFTTNGASQINRPEDWFNALPRYLEDQPFIERWNAHVEPRFGDNSVWICPEAKLPDDGVPRGFLPYGMNMALSVWSSFYADGVTRRPDHIERVGPKQTMVFMADSIGLYASTIPYAADYSPVARHNGMVNIAFLDAHVAPFDGDYVGCGVKGDPQRPDIKWYTPNGTWPPLPY
jgi:prepilin-type processing-associated H-X9-DG protein/prepilin-type N-terminal cleavage/methylation domain-containing protein